MTMTIDDVIAYETALVQTRGEAECPESEGYRHALSMYEAAVRAAIDGAFFQRPRFAFLPLHSVVLASLDAVKTVVARNGAAAFLVEVLLGLQRDGDLAPPTYMMLRLICHRRGIETQVLTEQDLTSVVAVHRWPHGAGGEA